MNVAPLGEAPFSGRIARWDEEGLAVTVDGATILLERNRLRSLRFEEAPLPADRPAPPNAVHFSNGDRLLAANVRVSEDLLTLSRDAERMLEFPLSYVTRIVFGEQPRELRHLPSPEETSTDSLLLTNLDRIQGEFRSLTDEAMEFETVLGAVRIERHRLLQLDLNPELVDPPPPPGTGEKSLLYLADGSSLTVTDLSFQVPRGWKGELQLGPEAVLASDELQRIDHYAAHVVSLAELSPLSSEGRFLFGESFAPRTNVNVLGGTIAVAGEHFGRGIGTSSRSTIEYEIPPGGRTFLSRFGLDDAAGELGAVSVSVLVDDEPRWTREVVTQRDGLVTTGPIDLAGAGRLTLHVDFGPRGDIQALANWVDPIVVTTR